MLIRKPTDTDYSQIYNLLERAFAPSVTEAELVKNLRNKSKISVDFVAVENGGVKAYVCYTAAYDGQKNKIGLHLAPVAVLPERQHQGIGQRIVKESLTLLRREQPVYVLGDPEYYIRFGFRKDKTQKCAFDSEGEHFMVLSDGPLPPRDVLYEDEFMV